MQVKSYFPFAAILIVFSILFGCGNNNKSQSDKAESKATPKVSVYYLHQKKSCPTCKAVGSVSRSTTEKYFKQELSDGKVAYFDLDISEPANDSIAVKFECNWSGLYIYSSGNGKEVKEDLTDVAFMYAVNNPDTLEQIVKSSITKKL
jgi:hypothetical protein